MTMHTINTDPRDLTADDIINQCCHKWVPVNCRVDTAIEAHRLASGDIAEYVLRAVILAATRTVEEGQQQLDYLTRLPIKAWPGGDGYTPNDARRETLAGIARSLNWERSCG